MSTTRSLNIFGLALLTLGGAGPMAVRELPPRGSITGTVRYTPEPPPRVAARYGGAPARTMVAIPTVVYLEGVVPGATPARGASQVMAQRDTAFVPPLLVVPIGGEVTFPNEDSFYHNVFSYSRPKRFDLGRYPNPESKAMVFDAPGVVHVFCEVHKSMRGVILVVENLFWVVPGEDGTFTLPDVPAGSYTLVAWNVDTEPREVRVTVPAQGSVRVDIEL
ncbi:MAG: DUF2012 domain-containing protein [Gemmatimonadota bacterium]